MKDADSKNSILLDVVRFRRSLAPESVTAIKAFQKRNSLLAFQSVALNWALITSMMILVMKTSPIFWPIAIFLIGSRQRALSNLVHDASHGNLIAHRKANDLIANLFAGWPMMDSVQNYRSSHAEHHRHLGRPVLDPDFENHRRYGFDDLCPPRNAALKTYLKLLFNASAWKDSLVGALPSLKRKELFFVVVWWTVAALAMLSLSPELGSTFLLTWIVARATSYHAIRIFAEFLDHSGLKPESVLSYTRNIPGALRPLAGIFHPHSDNFHLVHHLLPQIPHYRLKEAHEILLQDERYKSAHHCDGYFVGRYSAIKSWSGEGQAS